MENIINNYPAAWQAAMGIILKPVLSDMEININIGDLCSTLGIGRTSAYDAKEYIRSKLFSKLANQDKVKELEIDLRKAQADMKERDFINEILTYKIEHPDSYIEGVKRPYYSDNFKMFILELKTKYNYTLEKISKLSNIPVDTLKKFQKVKESAVRNEVPEQLPENIIKLINKYLRSKSNKSVKEFCNQNPELLKELNMNYRQILSWLKKLGFVNPKGIFLNNTGLDRIIRFCPNSIWGTDGKNMTIIINGYVFRWVWQCLIDYKTTVIVGGIVAEEETTNNLLQAIKSSKEKTGVSPLAIVLDNRLSENLPAISEYLNEFDIEIIKTFPGNPKSNGILEGNFNIFERWVGGEIFIDGDNPEELSRSIAQMLVEIFTQLRNNKPRKAISMKTSEEIMNEAKDNPPSPKEIETIKEKIKELADRLKREQAVPVISQEKQKAIDLAVKEVKPKDEETFRKRLSPFNYSHYLILQAIAIFQTRKQESPEKNYDHKYYGGILRNLADDQAVEWLNTNLEDIFFHKFNGLEKKYDEEIINSLKINPEQTCVNLAKDYLKMPVPAWSNMILLQLKELFLMATGSSLQAAKDLCDKISRAVVRWTYEARRKRERLLCKLYEWVNYVQLYENV